MVVSSARPMVALTAALTAEMKAACLVAQKAAWMAGCLVEQTAVPSVV